jgi:hypothetical protein
MRQFAIACVLLLFTGTSFACTGAENQPGQTIDVNFSKNSSVIDGANMLALANWTVDFQLKYPILESVSIVGLAAPEESNPKALAEKRANNVHRALDLFGVRAPSASVIGRVYKSMLPASKYEPTGTHAEVTLVPGCPNKCCTGQ